MNSLGKNYRVTIYGESHGVEVGIIIDGCPPGLTFNIDDLQIDLDRRKPGQIGTTGRIEDDIPLIRSGVFQGKTTGAPIQIAFENQNIRPEVYIAQRNFFRPGHADFAANKKYYGFEDYRGGGHFSGRLTVGIVAAGYFAKLILSHLCPLFSIKAIIESIGGDTNIQRGLQRAIDLKDSIGGIIKCNIEGILPGVGEPFFDSLESILSHAIFSIPAVKGIEFGAGFSGTKMVGTEYNDSVLNDEGLTKTNHSGGINGGISNGNPIIFNIAVKPSSSTPKEQFTFHHTSGQMEKTNIKGRHDLCIALRMPIIVEAMSSIVIADMLLIRQSQQNIY